MNEKGLKPYHIPLQFQISNDQYHEKPYRKEIFQKYVDTFGENSAYLTREEKSSILNMGHAQGFGTKTLGLAPIPIAYDTAFSKVINNCNNRLLYVCANGNIFTHCDFSHKLADMYKISNIKENNLYRLAEKLQAREITYPNLDRLSKIERRLQGESTYKERGIEDLIGLDLYSMKKEEGGQTYTYKLIP